jgi:hypothetical protein
MLYRLACSCGATHLVATSQAGQQLTCSCGKPLPIPTLRELRELPVAETPSQPRPGDIDRADARRPSVLVGLMFAVIVLALPTAIFFTYQRLTVDTSYTQASDREQALEALDKASPAELSAIWSDFSTEGLGLPTKPMFYHAQRSIRMLEWKMATAWGVTLLAAIAAGAVWTLRRQRDLA